MQWQSSLLAPNKTIANFPIWQNLAKTVIVSYSKILMVKILLGGLIQTYALRHPEAA